MIEQKYNVLKVPKYKYSGRNNFKVNAIVLSKDNVPMLIAMVKSLFKQHPYLNNDNFNLIIMDTGSKKTNLFDLIKKLNKLPQICCIELIQNQYYHYSKNHNIIFKYLTYEEENNMNKYILLINDDIEFINDNIGQFLDIMANDTQNVIGTLGSQLLFKNQLIQHQGINCQVDKNNIIQFGHINYKTANYQYHATKVLGNTGALLFMKQEDYFPLDESLELFQDVKLNIDIINKGKDNYCVNSAISFHYESQSRHKDDLHVKKDQEVLKRNSEMMQVILKDNIKMLKEKYTNVGKKGHTIYIERYQKPEPLVSNGNFRWGEQFRS